MIAGSRFGHISDEDTAELSVSDTGPGFGRMS